MSIECIMLLLPIVFMIHEYEEIVMFRHWLYLNRKELTKRFPKFEKFLARQNLFDYSTATFAIGTACEFILVTIISIYAVWQEVYQLWLALLIGHSVHLLMHIIQWLIYRKYIPVIISTLLTLPYCIYAFAKILDTAFLSISQIILWTFIGIIFAALSFPLVFYLMSKFHNWEVRARK